MKYIISIDAGTTSSRSIIFNKKGDQIGLSQYEFPQYFPHEGWVEHNPNEIWETQIKAMLESIKNAKIKPNEIAAIGITNQRETTVVWDRKTGKPLYNAIVWQDRRTSSICDELEEKKLAPLFLNKTGLILDAYFSGTKIKWILDSDPKIRKKAENGELAFGTIDSWLIWNLTNGKVHVTDVSNASRTLLFNIHTLKWDETLIDILNIPKSLLPKVVSSSEVVGYCSKDIFGVEIPISGIAGDQQAALFGQLCVKPGDIKNTYGTGCFCIMNTGSKAVKSKNKMLTTIGWEINGEVTYAIEGSIFVAGALIQWLRDQLGIIKKAADIEELALTVEDNGGITFIPALAGLGAPYWAPHATGAIMGITRGTQSGHIARAALESIALRTRDIIIEMQKDAGVTFTSFKVDGGASKNNLLMQIQADFIEKTVIRPKITETTALGAAFFAGLAVGFWPSIDSLSSIWKKDKSFIAKPNKTTKKALELWEKRILNVLN